MDFLLMISTNALHRLALRVRFTHGVCDGVSIALRCVLVIVLAIQTTDAASPQDQLDKIEAPPSIAPLLDQYCTECHGAETQEANLRFDRLELDGTRLGDEKTLQRMLTQVEQGEMPPEEQLTHTDRETLLAFLTTTLNKIAISRRESGTRSRNRRLTVEEYNRTMQALFGVDAEFAEMLPPDPIAESGYHNDLERLGLSSLQIETYLDAARRAVNRYLEFAGEDRKAAVYYHVEFEDLYYSGAERYETRKRCPQPIDWETFVERRAKNQENSTVYTTPLAPRVAGPLPDDERLRAAIPKLHQQYLALPSRPFVGELLIRIKAAGTADRFGRFPQMRVSAGVSQGDGCSVNQRTLNVVEVRAPIDQPETYKFRIRLEDVPSKGVLKEEESFDRLSVFDMDHIYIDNATCDSESILALGPGGRSDQHENPDVKEKLQKLERKGVCFLHLDCVEIEMQTGVDAIGQPYPWRVPQSSVASTESEDERSRIRPLLAQFMRHAFRRPVTAPEIDRKVQLFQLLRQTFPFQDAVRETFAAVLVSPSFLFIESHPSPEKSGDSQQITSHALAARLSYLLWVSPPDSRLNELADDRSILRPEILRAEAERLLADERSHRFHDSFCRQWLRLDRHSNVAVDREAYPDWDDDLSALSIAETLALYSEVFASGASALDLIDSSYAMLNDRLAYHYELPDVLSGQLRKVDLPPGSTRGGLLTQSSLLTMNSNGLDSHPVRRGAWLLERILHDPPPPPPPNVPQIDAQDPDFRGLSLRQQIELHRKPSACQKCHQKIDPWGLAFENFDAVGRWRESMDVETDNDLGSEKIDASVSLPDGNQIRTPSELKTYLREHRNEQFAAALVHHMFTYAMGREPDYADKEQVDQITSEFRASGLKLKELVLAIIGSELFLER